MIKIPNTGTFIDSEAKVNYKIWIDGNDHIFIAHNKVMAIQEQLKDLTQSIEVNSNFIDVELMQELEYDKAEIELQLIIAKRELTNLMRLTTTTDE